MVLAQRHIAGSWGEVAALCSSPGKEATWCVKPLTRGPCKAATGARAQGAGPRRLLLRGWPVVAEGCGWFAWPGSGLWPRTKIEGSARAVEKEVSYMPGLVPPRLHINQKHNLKAQAN